jgi:hypothetical protein
MARRDQLFSIGLFASVFVAAWAGVFACSQTETKWVDVPDDSGTDKEPEGGVQPSPDSGLGILTFRPDQGFSGVDGVHTFTFPVAVYDSANDLKVTSSDPSVEIVPKQLVNPVNENGADNGKYFFITAKQAGTFTLTAKSGGKTATFSATIADYSPSAWTAGETRYKNGGSSGDPPCTDCHVNGQAIDHSPAHLSSVDDEEVGVIITTGILNTRPIMIDNKPGHRWKVTTEERAGLVVYLRALTPRGFK